MANRLVRNNETSHRNNSLFLEEDEFIVTTFVIDSTYNTFLGMNELIPEW